MNSLERKGDEELMLEIKAGNMLAFDALYRKYSGRLYKFAFSLIKVPEEAENIVQDVFLKLWLNREKVDKATSVKYYVFSIAYHSSISLLRKKIRESRYIEFLQSKQEVSGEPASVDAEFNELNEKLDRILETLPSRQREIYRLHRVEGMKHSEIAEKLGISTNTIETHLSRALKTIRQQLGDYSVTAILFWYLFV